MTINNSILIADDDHDVISALKLALKNQPYDIVTASTPHEVLTLAERKPFACMLIDLNYTQDTTSGQEGISLIKALRQLDANVPVIAMTGFSNVNIAVEMMKNGANDFLEKPWRNSQLSAKIEQQIAHGQTKRANQKLAQENALLKAENPTAVISQSTKMNDVLSQIRRIALSDMNVLFTGENGTGKSLLAKYLHQHSTRQAATFLQVNMGAISDNLFESEMFGHVKGAFTDAKEERIGRFELAAKGTLFLDEIANINVNQQAKLLHVLEERKFERVGGVMTLDADVRLISATNSDLSVMVKNNQFRQDLLYRLNTIEIHIPALRERSEDIIPLATNFLNKLSLKYKQENKTLSDDAINALLTHHWPGNVRELSHTMERALFMSANEEITANDLNLPKQNVNQNTYNQEQTLEQIEKRIIIERLHQFDKDPNLTAQSLGLSRSAYYRRLEKYQLN